VSCIINSVKQKEDLSQGAQKEYRCQTTDPCRAAKEPPKIAAALAVQTARHVIQ
jgi:hypothetical protein